MDRATLRLFNAIQVISKTRIVYDDDTIKRGIMNGYILDDFIPPHEKTLLEIESIIGISGEKANATFHKSWQKIHDASMEQLIIEQIVHYMTTYGFEALGIYDKDIVYIPNEILELPEGNIPLTVIHAMTKEEILEQIIKLGGSGIALHETTLKDIMTIVEGNEYNPQFVDEIKNRELLTRLRDYYHIVPIKPEEFLRYVISKLTDEFLIIKNQYLIDKIKSSNGKFLDELLTKAPHDLGSIFLRYKPLFLAMKSISRNKRFFNQLRKQSMKLHKPLPKDYLNSITEQISHDMLDEAKLRVMISHASIFRKIRLAYALNYRLNPCNSILYRIRNGRGWSTDFKWNGSNRQTYRALQIVLDSIQEELSEYISGKTIYIPSYVHYTLPATEKQFTGFMPMGSWVSVPQNMVAGIHWINTDKRVDLDLSITNANFKLGWDAGYRTPARSIMFSGDITDAPPPNGATELFFFKNELQPAMLMHVNYYNHYNGDKVMAKIIIAGNDGQIDRNHMLDTSKILATAMINIDQKQMTLGFIMNTGGENRFYFSPTSIGKAITSSVSKAAIHTRNYYGHILVNSIELKDILEGAGAIIINEKPEDGEYINLAPENLMKNTIIDILNGF